MSANFQQLANFIWSVADLLRGPYRPPQYERVMLPLTVLRRFDAVLAPTKENVLARYETLKGKEPALVDRVLNEVAKNEDGTALGFHNHSQLDFYRLKGDPDNIARHLTDYINSFSENVRKIFERFDFEKEIEKLEESNRLYQIVSQFAEIDLHPNRVDNITMGLVFEDLIRRFNESANETAGDHFTPREVIQLMVNLLLEPDTNVLTQAGVIVTICDPACGTGGMLAEAQNWIRAHNEQATVKVYGQDYNPRSYAVAASDLLIKGQKDSRVELGNTLTDDRFSDMHWFDYLLANPPFGVDWKAEKKEIDRWPNFRGYTGKLPRINDGALLFLLHMISKFADYQPGNKDFPGSRAAIVFNGSPLFTGGAGSGESDIRRWIIEHDMLEAIVALPEQMFYNTGIGTFIWVVTNRKSAGRKKKIQLIDARERYTPMKRSLGDKRRYLDQAAIDAVTRDHGACSNAKHWVRLDKDGKPLEWRNSAPAEKAPEGQKWIERNTSQVFDNTDFGYHRITVLRPLRLRFEITDDARERFLNTCPELFDALQAVQDELGTEPYSDWNRVWDDVQRIFKHLPDDVEGWAKGAKGTAQKKIFRDCFTTTDPDVAPVIAKRHKNGEVSVSSEWFPGQTLPALEAADLYALLGLFADGKTLLEYEPDPALKDTENIPLKEDIISYVLREVRPYVADAWIDRETLDEQDGGIGKVGYEINFNIVVPKEKMEGSLQAIDTELRFVGQRIIEFLRTPGTLQSVDTELRFAGQRTVKFHMTRVKYICRLGYGDALPKDDDSDGDIPVFGSNGQYATTANRNTGTPAIVLGRKGSYGKVNWAQDGCFASDTTFYIDSRFTKSNLRWLYWALQTLNLDEGSQEAAVPGLNRETVYEQRLPVPSDYDQKLIASYLDREIANIDSTLDVVGSRSATGIKEGSLLALLFKRRAELITAAVTGQIPLEEMIQ